MRARDFPRAKELLSTWLLRIGPLQISATHSTIGRGGGCICPEKRSLSSIVDGSHRLGAQQ